MDTKIEDKKYSIDIAPKRPVTIIQALEDNSESLSIRSESRKEEIPRKKSFKER